MKTIIWLLCLLKLPSLVVHSKGGDPKTFPENTFCGENEITDWTLNSTAPQCRECPVCPTGYGSTFPCGGVKKYPHEKPIRCERCITGKTFSNSWNTDMCSPCTNCSLHNRKVLDTCTIFKDTVCGGCEDGYYEFRNESTGNNTCAKCSRCCDDGKDNKIQECIDQGLPSSGQVCSVFEKERCKPKPTRSHRDSRITMTHQNDKLSTISTTTQLKENEQGASNGSNVVVITLVAVALLCVVVALIAWYWCEKKKKKTDTNGSDVEHGGNELTDLLIGHHGYRDSKFKPNTKSLKPNDCLYENLGACDQVFRHRRTKSDPCKSNSFVPRTPRRLSTTDLRVDRNQYKKVIQSWPIL